MVTFQVNDMRCGHCASSIARAVASVDKAARLDIHIQDKRVRVDSDVPVSALAQAIRDAGYTPQEVRRAPARPVAVRATSGCGCGCGCGTPKPAALDARQSVAAAAGGCCG